HEGRLELAPHHDTAERRLHEDEPDRRQARHQDLTDAPVLPPGDYGLQADQDHRDRREESVGVLDDRVSLERRDPPTEAGGPPRTPEPRTRRSDEPPGRDEQDRRSGGGDRELLKARHRSSRARPNDSSTRPPGEVPAPRVGILPGCRRSTAPRPPRRRRRSMPCAGRWTGSSPGSSAIA